MFINRFRFIIWLKRRKKRLTTLMLLSLFTSCAICITFGVKHTSLQDINDPQYFNLSSPSFGRIKRGKVEYENSKSVILMWTKFYRYEMAIVVGSMKSGRASNPRCMDGMEITADRSRLEEATAILFYHFVGNLNRSDLPPTRKPKQLWVLYGVESPHWSPSLTPFNKLFNLTMTYRRDSDIWSPYGRTLKLKEPLGQNDTIRIGNVSLNTLISGKTKLLAGAISHCKTDSKRENVIERMKKANISFDIYGSCGIKVCPRLNKTCNSNKFWEKVTREYKFFFAAENSICIDYITEKFWRCLHIGVVPVVYGGGNYTFEAPPGSFIDARNFKSPAHLVRFLQRLGREPEQYKKYYEWRRNYTVQYKDPLLWDNMCDFYEYIRNYRKALDLRIAYPRSKINYERFDEWWLNAPTVKGETLKPACSKPFWNV